MRKYLVVFFLALTNQVFSQSDLGFAPVGASWHYTTFVGSGIPQTGYTKYTVFKDTLINGKQCSEISISGNQVIPNNGLTNPFYVHYDSNRVYWQNIMTGQFDLLYDFNANVGESWTVRLQCDSSFYPWNISDSIIYTVDSVYFDTVNGMNLKHLITSIEPNNINQSDNIHIAEYLGGISLPFPHNFNCGAAGLHMWYGILRCYEDSAIGQNIWQAPCDILEVGLEDQLDSNPIAIKPNPVSQILSIHSYENLKLIQLKDINGAILLSHEIDNSENSIDVSKYPNGLYLITTYSKSGISKTQKVIIQH